MLLTIDVGNSYLAFGIYKNDELVFVSQLRTSPRRSADQYAVELKNIMELYGVDAGEIDGAMISSVVPDLTRDIEKAVLRLTGVRALTVGPGVKTGLNISIDNPAQLGADIVATAVAALNTQRLPCVIFDLGTATTVSVIDENGKFIGVVIAAGVGTTLDMFTSRTALLPHVSIETPRTVIGRNTVQSMQSGLVCGTACMIDGLAKRIERELGREASLIATGAAAEIITAECERAIDYCPNLLMDGLKLIYEKNTVGYCKSE
jgi:type III pantothenate kinase